MSTYHPHERQLQQWLHRYDPKHFAAPVEEQVDPVELAISQGHAVAIDLLSAILAARTPSRALHIHELMQPLIETLQTIQLAALGQADDVNVEHES